MSEYSTSNALLEVMGTLKRFVDFRAKSDRLVASMYVLLTHCFDLFDTLPFLLVTGPYGSGKTQLLEVFHQLCLRALFVSEISKAAFYRTIHNQRGTLIIDEAEDLKRYGQRSFSYSTLDSGNRRDGRVVRADARSGGNVQFCTYGPKIVAKIGGIAHKALKSRFITIQMERTESRVERFSLSRHSASMEAMRSRLETLFQQDDLRQLIQDFYNGFEGIDGQWGRETDLWAGLLAIAQAIDSERSKPTVHDRVMEIARADIEQKREESFFLDWDTKCLLSIFNYLKQHNYDSEHFIVAEDLRNHVVKELTPRFPLRTERLGRILNSYSLLLERKIKWIRREDGSEVQKTSYRIDTRELSRLRKKYDRYFEPKENESTSMKDVLTDVGRPAGWPEDKDPI